MMRRWLAALALLLAGCSTGPAVPATALPNSTRMASSSGELTPFQTFTPRPLPTATDPATLTPLPSPTPTPRTHTVARGEDMGGIAFRYGISLPALMAANPAINPSAMSIGAVLIIPAGAATPTGQPPTPAPQGVSLGRVRCYPTAEKGAVCFIPVANAQDQAVENVTAVVRMAAADGQTLSRTAAALLNRLLPGQTTALSVYFPPPAPSPDRVSAQLLTALPLQTGGSRYLEAELQSQQISISDDGRSAQVQAEAALQSEDAGAASVWVAAVAYDADDQVVGLRRWESSGPLKPGERLTVRFTIYSAGGPITRIETQVEARP